MRRATRDSSTTKRTHSFMVCQPSNKSYRKEASPDLSRVSSHTSFRRGDSKMTYGCLPVKNSVRTLVGFQVSPRFDGLTVKDLRMGRTSAEASPDLSRVSSHTSFRRGDSKMTYGCLPVKNSVRTLVGFQVTPRFDGLTVKDLRMGRTSAEASPDLSRVSSHTSFRRGDSKRLTDVFQ